CGQVRGRVKNAGPRTVNRVVCYCDDCQAFLHHLGRADLLDAHGGSDIVQVAPASLAFHQGTDRIVGLRLAPKGLYRWYASCCNTPVGNAVGPAIPFVGIIAGPSAGRPAARTPFSVSRLPPSSDGTRSAPRRRAPPGGMSGSMRARSGWSLAGA